MYRSPSFLKGGSCFVSVRPIGMFLDPQNVQSIKLTGPSNWFPALSEKSIKMGSVISTAGIY
jgi:hypothetical protein